jgi:hypothetical protein
MITRNDNNNNKKRLVALTGVAAITLLVASIAVIGATPSSFSTQQEQSQEQSASNLDLSLSDQQASSIERGSSSGNGAGGGANGGGGGDGGSSNGFSLQATERSNSVTLVEGEDEPGFYTVSVQCNSDEVVTGGGFDTGFNQQNNVVASKKQGNGWTITSFMTGFGGTITLTVYAECLKVVPTNAG